LTLEHQAFGRRPTLGSSKRRLSVEVFVITVPPPIRTIADQWAQDYLALADAQFMCPAAREQFKFWLYGRLTLFRELSRSTEPVFATDAVLAEVADTARSNLDLSAKDGLTAEASQVLDWLSTVERRPVWA
jgi:hypothetical protein